MHINNPKHRECKVSLSKYLKKRNGTTEGKPFPLMSQPIYKQYKSVWTIPIHTLIKTTALKLVTSSTLNVQGSILEHYPIFLSPYHPKQGVWGYNKTTILNRSKK